MASTVPAGKKENYESLFASCIIKENRYPEIDGVTAKMAASKDKYESVAAPLSIPWYVVAIVHCMEGSLRFDKHLHNGDPLTARTIHVPKNRPVTGNPTFSWEQSANDALRLQGLQQWNNWEIAGILFQLERYNGLGYYKQGINSPYLWSCSNHFSKGKYVQDGRFDPNATSKQIGAAVLLRRLREQQHIILEDRTLPEQIIEAGNLTPYNPGTATESAKRLQELLNSAGAVLRLDGKAGERTSDEYFKLSGKYLKGDPRN